MSGSRPPKVRVPLTPEQITALLKQVRLAETGQAQGQCPDCGAYETNGSPPLLHDPKCPSATRVIKAPVKIKRQPQRYFGVIDL